MSPATAPITPTPDSAYSSGNAYGRVSPDMAATDGDASEQGSTQGSMGGAAIERKKSGGFKGMLKKLKA